VTRFIAFINEKGGTGKTTLAVNVASYFASKKNRRVLLVDLDTQGHAGKSLGIDARASAPNVFHLLTDPAMTLEQVTRSTALPNLWVVPAWKEMAEFPTVAADDAERALRLKRRLADAADGRFDFVIFDAPPSLGLVSSNILVAAHEIVVPVATTYLSLDGCAEIIDSVKKVVDTLNPQLRVTVVIPTMYRKSALSDEIVAKLRAYFPKRVTQPLGFNVAIDEAQSHGQTIWEYAPWSRGATMLQTIAEVVDKGA
jgi:chromosome partitioning protein